MPDITLVKFNIQNVKYALPEEGGAFGAPKSMGYSTAMALDADYSEKPIFGDGRKIAVISSDKGLTGSITVHVLDPEYEVAMGRKIKTAKGYADIKQLKSITHALYFEICELKESGNVTVAKSWLYGVTSGRASASYTQTTDDISESSFQIPLTIKGSPLLKSDGTTQATDAFGNVMYVWQQTAVPGDTDYETFGDTVALPQLPTEGI